MKDLGFGKVKFEGKEDALTQQPYIDGPADDIPYYRAMAVDAAGDEYEVKWEVVENWEKIEDEQEMVEDWESPVSVKKL